MKNRFNNRNKMILAAFVLQILLLASVISLVYAVSVNGRTVVIEMTGYDPYDALRGRYLQLDLPAREVILEPDSLERYRASRKDEQYVYVILDQEPGSRLSRFAYASLDRPAPDTPYIKCMSRYLWTSDGESRIDIYPRISQYYLNEHQADQLDRSVSWNTRILLTLKLWHGMYVIDGMEIDGVTY